MIKPLVNQPSAIPTNKLMVAALVQPAVSTSWTRIMDTIYEPIASADVAALVGASAAFLVGYFVRDRENT